MNTIAFIGGGNMASAILGGLAGQGRQLLVVEPDAAQRERLQRDFGARALASADAALAEAELVVWAVKPQAFREAAAPCAPHIADAVQLSVMAGIRTDAIARATGAGRVVRAMPNTPALIGQGMTGLFALPDVSADERGAIEHLLASTGQTLWVDREADLDAVTALSGSGPAYVFYFVEAMVRAGTAMGLSTEQATKLALGTFGGATALAGRSDEPPSVLRERVTSKGGTTYAALQSMEADHVGDAIVRALNAAQARARELGDEFGQA